MAITGSLARAQVVLPYYTNIPEDVITNTFYFSGPGTVYQSTWCTDITAFLQTFYQSVYSTTRLAPNVVRTSCYVKWFDMTQPQPRVPIAQVAFTPATAASATGYVEEAAAVLSFQGTKVSGLPQARRRGRVYIGGLSTAAFTASSSNTFTTVNATMVTAMQSAAAALRTALLGYGATPGTHHWSVWSPTDQQDVYVADGWVDNGPDTQRRRGSRSPSRTLWP